MPFSPLEQELLHHSMPLVQNGQSHSAVGSWERNLGGRAPPWTFRFPVRTENAGFHSSSSWAPWGTPLNSSPVILPSKEPQTWGNWLRSLSCCRAWSVASWSVSYITCIKLLTVHWWGSSASENSYQISITFFHKYQCSRFFLDKGWREQWTARNSHKCLYFHRLQLIDWWVPSSLYLTTIDQVLILCQPLMLV